MAEEFDHPSEEAVSERFQSMNLREDERDYVNIVCQDPDFNVLSRMLTKSAEEIGRSLGLKSDVLEQIEATGQDRPQKILKSLAAWTERMTEEEKAPTWGVLAECLSALNEDPSVVKEVKEYVATAYNREAERGQLHSTSSEFHTENTTSTSEEQDQVFIGAAGTQETGNAGPSKMVPGGACHPSYLTERPPEGLREELRELDDEFEDILLEAQKSLHADESRVLPDLRLMFVNLSVRQENEVEIAFFNKSVSMVMSKSTIQELFLLATKYKIWGVFNFHCLKRVMEKFIPREHEIHGKLTSYAGKVEKIKKATLLHDYMLVWREGKSNIPGSSSLIVKVDRHYSNFTLADLQKLKRYLADEFKLNEFIFHLKEAGSGCVRVTWSIPTSAIQFLMPEVFIGKHIGADSKWKILEFIVDERFLYKNAKPLPAPRKLYPRGTGVKDHEYQPMYKKSIDEPESFWSEQGKRFLVWDEPFTKADNCSKEEGTISWFAGGKLNVSTNCLDRHAEKNPEKIAMIWEKTEPGKHEKITYGELLETTCRVANVLKNQCGVKKGDVVAICMPTMPLTVATMLACARIGAVHCVLFAALNVKGLEKRFKELECKVVVTGNVAQLGDSSDLLKKKVDKALKDCSVQHVLVANAPGIPCRMQEGRDISLEEAMKKERPECKPVSMDSEDDLFIMYTSGTTDEPNGIVHGQAGYLLYAAMTHKYVFDYQEGDVFACVSVLGWITGHTYVVYGPLCNGATTVLFEGLASYPDAGRYWKMVEEHKVNQFYTTPSAIRKLMRAGDHYVTDYDLSSLKTIGSVGEPLPTEAWTWYYEVVGKKNCILVDTYWQTETGGIVLSPQPGPVDGSLKPGCSMRPFFGVVPVITDEKGEEIMVEKKVPNGVQGLLCLRKPTPGMGRKVTLRGGTKSFRNVYFSNSFPHHKDLFFTRDWAYRDVDGDYQIVGRKEDIIRIKGVWIELPEVESHMVKQDRRIQEASLIRVPSPTSTLQDDSTCAVLQVKPALSDDECVEVVENVTKGLYTYVLPQLVLLCPKQTESLSEKTSRTYMKNELSSIINEILKFPDPPTAEDRFAQIPNSCRMRACRYSFKAPDNIIPCI